MLVIFRVPAPLAPLIPCRMCYLCSSGCLIRYDVVSPIKRTYMPHSCPKSAVFAQKFQIVSLSLRSLPFVTQKEKNSEIPGYASALPHINSFMMKTESKEEQQQFFKPQSMSFEAPTKPDADEYQPTQDTLAEFYAHGFNTTLLDPSSSYTLAQMQYAQAAHHQPLMHYYEMPQMTLYQTEYDTNVPVYAAAPSPAYSPPPQDPSVTVPKPKKRIQAVPCHSNSICANCKTKETTLWRRNHVGEIECNACNLYFRKNNRKRPLSLRKDGILKRNRKPRCESPSTSSRAST